MEESKLKILQTVKLQWDGNECIFFKWTSKLVDKWKGTQWDVSNISFPFDYSIIYSIFVLDYTLVGQFIPNEIPFIYSTCWLAINIKKKKKLKQKDKFCCPKHLKYASITIV